MTIHEFEKEPAFRVFEIYIAVLAHFKKGKYNIFEKKAKILKKNLKEDFEKKKYFFHCLKIWNKYKKESDIIKLFFFNYLYNDDFWLGNVDFSLYIKETGKYKKLYYLYGKDLDFVIKNTTFDNINKVFYPTKEFEYSEFFNFYENEDISIETLIITNILTKFLDRIYDKKRDFIFEEEYRKVKYYEEFFIRYNTIKSEKYKKLFISKIITTK